MMSLLLGLTIACYVVSSLGYQGYILFQKRPIYQVSRIVLLAGFMCHTGFIALQYVEAGHIPVQTLHETLSAFGWAVVGVFLVLQIKFHLMVLGALVAPLATLAVIIAAMLPGPQVQLAPFFAGLWRTVHMGTLILGNAALAIACLVGILYLIQENAIKDKKRGFFFTRLPSLSLLDSVGYASLIVGFPLLTFGIISGAIYAQAVRGRFWTWNPREIFAVITWLLFAALLHERLVVGWRGRRAAFMAIVGFAVLLFTFFLFFVG
jgi:cytochrome c-type biogenesis protein CcsB